MTGRATHALSRARAVPVRSAAALLAWALAVYATTGGAAATAALLVVALCSVVRRPARLVLGVALGCAVALAPAWFLGSALGLDEPARRIVDNGLAHAVGGLFVWTLLLGVAWDVIDERKRHA